MTETEQQIRSELQESKGFLRRQQLLKALWHLKQQQEDRPKKSDKAAHAA